MRYVIIGNSAAAIGGVEGIRRVDPEGEITLISREPYPAYSRPLISYFLSGQVDARHMGYRPSSFYRDYRVTTRLGKEAETVDTEKSEVVLTDGERITYDRLLIAVGGVPFVPPIKGVKTRGVTTFTTYDDAKELKKQVRTLKKVVILGGGLIGIKAMEGLQAHGVRITIVELMDRILGLVLDKTASDILEKELQREGIQLEKGTTLREIVPDAEGKVAGVVLKDGRSLEADHVIIAIGVRPNLKVVEGTSIATNRGILVDEAMRTNVSNVFAAGDVAEADDLLHGEKRVIPILPNAYRQGRIAGLSMAGREAVYLGGLVMNSVEVGGIPAISAGIMNPPEGEGFEVKRFIDRKKNIYRKMVLKGDRLVGFILIGAIDRAGIYTGLIRERIDIRPFKSRLIEMDFGMIDFPKDLRTYKLSTVYM